LDERRVRGDKVKDWEDKNWRGVGVPELAMELGIVTKRVKPTRNSVASQNAKAGAKPREE
jgi:hypothetical protein